MGSSEPQLTLRLHDASPILGLYFRLLVPERSRIESVSGGRVVPVSNVESIETEAGRTVFGNYLMIPPGSATLTYAWVSPYSAAQSDAVWTYRLTVQKQPGTRQEPIDIQISVPQGMTIVEASPELAVDGSTARMTDMLTRDVQLTLRYGPTE